MDKKDTEKLIDKRLREFVFNELGFKMQRKVDTPLDATQVVPKRYVDKQLLLYLLLTGGTISGNLTVDGVVIFNSALTVAGAGTFESPVTFDSNVTVDGTFSALGNTTIGASSTNTLGFYGKTAITRQASTLGGVTSGSNYTTTERAMLNDAYSVLRNLGLLS